MAWNWGRRDRQRRMSHFQDACAMPQITKCLVRSTTGLYYHALDPTATK